MPTPRTLIITTAGINCDRELARAFEMAGAESEFVHLNRLMDAPTLIEGYDLIGLPGGFSYGDAVAAGRIAAQLMRQRLYPAFIAAIERGVPIIAPCNGFQVAVQMGLLPGPPVGVPWPAEPATASVALTPNDIGRFNDRWGARRVSRIQLHLDPGPRRGRDDASSGGACRGALCRSAGTDRSARGGGAGRGALRPG